MALWLRKFRLAVETGDGQEAFTTEANRIVNAVDYGEYRAVFHITQALKGVPCSAEVTVYNVSNEDIAAVQIPINQKTDQNRLRMVIEAGHDGHSGIIFNGEVHWRTTGREDPANTFMKLAGVSDYNGVKYAVCNTTLPKGASQEDVCNAILAAFAEKGVQTSNALDRAGELMPDKLAKAKAMYGNALQYAKDFAQTNDLGFTFGVNGIEFFGNRNTASEEVVKIGAATGMISYPVITPDGIEVTTLLNPDLMIGRIVEIDNADVQGFGYSTAWGNLNYVADNAMLSPTGQYEVVAVEHEGDTRGDAWYSHIICRGIDAAMKAPPSATRFWNNQ